MAMSRKHYVRIAQAFAETDGKYEGPDYQTEAVVTKAVQEVRDYLANELADMFQDDNPNFDRARFLEAARAVNRR